jgi:hypothetical protein
MEQVVATKPNGEMLIEKRNVIHVLRGTDKRLILWNFNHLCKRITLLNAPPKQYTLHFGLVKVPSAFTNPEFDLSVSSNNELTYFKQLSQTWRTKYLETQNYVDFKRVNVAWIEADDKSSFTLKSYDIKLSILQYSQRSNTFDSTTIIIPISPHHRRIPLSLPIRKMEIQDGKHGTIQLTDEVQVLMKEGKVDFSTFNHTLKEATHMNGSIFDQFPEAETYKSKTVNFSRLQDVIFVEDRNETYADDLQFFYTQYNVKLPTGEYKYA